MDYLQNKRLGPYHSTFWSENGIQQSNDAANMSYLNHSKLLQLHTRTFSPGWQSKPACILVSGSWVAPRCPFPPSQAFGHFQVFCSASLQALSQTAPSGNRPSKRGGHVQWWVQYGKSRKPDWVLLPCLSFLSKGRATFTRQSILSRNSPTDFLRVSSKPAVTQVCRGGLNLSGHC